jgi:3'-5' exoribonuclease
MKNTFIVDLAPGDDVFDQFVVRKAELREFAGGKMISLELVDSSGRINGVIWDSPSDLMTSIQTGGVYNIEGSVTTYKGKNQLTVKKIEKTEDFHPDDFLPKGPVDLDELEKRLNQAIENIEDDDYKNLIRLIFSESKIKDCFLRGVGGKLWHHNYIGGLAEHSLSIYDLCIDFASRYPELDKDLMLASAILHDIGKIDSYTLEGAIDYTSEGRLLGHIVIGDRIVSDAISKTENFPEEKALKLRHMILAHQGSLEQASPVPPMMPEAFALYTADLLDSKLSALRRIKNKEYRPGVEWSSYVNLINRHIYFGNKGAEDE